MDKQYPILTSVKAGKLLEHLRRGEDCTPSDFIEYRQCDEPIDLTQIASLRKILEKIKGEFPKELGLRSQEGGAFEAKGSEHIHKFFQSFPSQATDDPDFWKYICVIHFRDFVEWRHGGGDREANLANYGISAERRNLFLRMFYRAAVSLDPSSDDPYHLSKLGDEDLWKSHFGAVKIGNSPQVVKAFLKTVYPKNDKAVLKTKEVRSLAKNLTRLRSNVILELYDEASAVKLLKLEVVKLQSIEQ
jgi:hypothetical protein